MSWKMFVPNIAQASLGPVTVPSSFGAIPSGAGLYVMATILGTCLLSFAVTHVLYFFAVGREIGALLRYLRKRTAVLLVDGKGRGSLANS
jgi:hypothetical protein